MRWGVAIIASITLLVAGYVAYVKATYIDEKINIGSGYGFTVGQSKDEAYERAKSLYVGKTVYIPYPLRPDGYGPLHDYKFDEEDYKKISEENRWEFFFDEMDFIRLQFKDDKLVSIYRHRQVIGAP